MNAKTQPLNQFPPFVRAFLWSFDCDRLDIERDKRLVITQVLNLGTKIATDWVRTRYTAEDIKETLRTPVPGTWNRKSLRLWSLVYNEHPQESKRHIPL
jgi:hypothetical protein